MISFQFRLKLSSKLPIESLHLSISTLRIWSKHSIIKKVVGMWDSYLGKWLEDFNYDDKNDMNFYLEMLEKYTIEIWHLHTSLFCFLVLMQLTQLSVDANLLVRYSKGQ